MDDLRLTVEDAEKVLKKKRATLYRWMQQNKLRYTETPKGRIVLIDQMELDALIKAEQDYDAVKSIRLPDNINESQQDKVEYYENLSDRQRGSHSSNNETIDKLVEEIIKMKDELVLKSELAGQTRLLTQDNEFYKNEYFKLKYANEILQKRNMELEEQLKKKNSLFGFFKS